MDKLRVLDLFSGIGGFSLGLERTGGFETVAFCEIEPYCRLVLAKHWPNVPCYDDVRTLTADTLARDGIAVGVICGGFPCQDISVAGKGVGLGGERSGLWREYARIIGEVRPRFVIVENVSALLSRGLGSVLGDLAALGYDAEWHCIPAAAVGAPHRRDRLWIVAHTNQDAVRQQPISELWHSGAAKSGDHCEVAYSDETRSQGRDSKELSERASQWTARTSSPPVPDTNASDKFWRSRTLQMGWGRFASETLKDGDARGIEWRVEPDVGRVAHGVSSRVDRLGSLGNAVVPQIPELIGKAILEAEGMMP